MPGLWRLRLPLPLPGVPHCNAWAIAAGDGVVLVDTGMHEPGSLAQLERAIDQVNLRSSTSGCSLCTHAHADHWGQAAPIRDRAGCELWMHPNHAARHASADGPRARARPAARDRPPERRARGGAASATPSARGGRPSGIARVIEPDRPLVDGVEIETDLGVWTVHETPGHAPSHVCLYPARAPPADLRRPRARPDLAVLRLRLDARPGRRVPGLAGRGRRARRAARAVRPRQAVRRRPRPHRGQPRARARAARRRGRRRRSRAADRDRDRRRRLRRAADRDATPAGGCRRRSATCSTSSSRAGCRARRRATWSAGTAVCGLNLDTILSRLVQCRHHADRSRSSPRADEPVFSFEFFPPEDRRGRAEPPRRRCRALRELEPDFVSVTYGAGGSTRGRTLELTKWIKQELGIEAMAHLSCVGATREELRVILDSIADAGIENVLALRGDPPRGETEWRPHPGRPALLDRAGRADLGPVPDQRRRGLLPGGPSRGARPGARPALPQAEGRRRRLVPDHPAVLRQRALLPVRRGGAGGRDRRPDHPRDHADHRRGPDQDDHRTCAAPRSPTRCSSSSSSARPIPSAVLQLGRLLRHAAVRRAAGPRRARDPLLHAEPLAGHAGDPLGAEAAAPVGAARGGRDRLSRSGRRDDLQVVGEPRLAVDLVADVDLVVALVGPDPPEAEEPGPAARASGGPARARTAARLTRSGSRRRAPGARR